MADKKRKLTVEILGENQQLSRQLADAEKKLGSFEDKVTRAGEKMADVGKKMTVGLTLPIAAAGAASFKMAADLQDSIGATEQIFKGASKDVEDWADSLPSYYGIAKGEAHEYANIMGSLMQNLGGMSEQEAAKQAGMLTELAGDLAAMYGGTTEEAVNAMTSALKGNTEMLDNYGISATAASLKAKAFEMGIGDGTSVLTDQQKQAAMLAIIVEQTGAAQGQAAREAEGASGQMRALTTEIKNTATEMGTQLLPIGVKVLGFLSDLVGLFSELSPGGQTAVLAIAGFVAALGPILTVSGNVMTASVRIRDALTTVGDTGDRELTKAGNAAKTFSLAIGGVAAAFTALQVASAINESTRDLDRFGNTVEALKFDGTKEDLELLGKAIDQAGGDFDKAQNDVLNFTGAVGTVELGDGLSRPITEIQRALDTMIDNGQFEQAAGLIDMVASSLERGATNENFTTRNQFKRLSDEVLPEYREEIELAVGAQDKAAESVGKVGDSADATGGQVDGLRQDMEEQKAATEDAGKAWEDYADAVSAMADPFFAAADAASGLAAAQDKAAWAALALMNEATPENLKAYADANEDAASAAFDNESAMLRLRGEIERNPAALQTTIDKLNHYVATGQITRGQADQMIDGFKGVTFWASAIPNGKHVNVTTNANDVTGQLMRVLDMINRIGNSGSLAGVYAATFGGGGGSDGDPRTPFASGGLVGGSGSGDRVPALLTPGEMVIRKPIVDAVGADSLLALNAGRAGGAAGMIVVENHFHGPVAQDSAEWVADVVADAVRRGLMN